MKYRVEVPIVYSRIFLIEASSQGEALEMAQRGEGEFIEGDFPRYQVLDPEKYIFTDSLPNDSEQANNTPDVPIEGGE